MKNGGGQIAEKLRKGLAELLDDTKYRRNIDAVRKANLDFYKLFNVVMLLLLTLLYLSTLLSDYARSMRLVYVLFFACTVAEMGLLFSPLRRGRWVTAMCYFGVFKAYAFCMLSSVFFNIDAPAITFYVFMILIPVCFTFRIRVMLLLQTAVAVSFNVCTWIVKEPSLVLSDNVNCWIFMLIGVIMAVLSTRTRVENFEMFRRSAEEEKRNKEIFDATPCGILELTFTGRRVQVLFANRTAAAMVGYDEAAFWQKQDWDYADLVHKEDLPLIDGALQGLVVGRENACDFRLKSEADGGYHWVSCKSRVTKVNGERSTVLVDILDVDEKKRAESESDAKSRFLSRMSHEIRTPINAILGMAELERQALEEMTPDLNALRSYANETTEASKYLLTLVNDVLDTSRIENNRIELHIETVEVEKCLRSVIGLVKPLADAKQIDFTCTRSERRLGAYLGDRVRIQQILVNLLSNAIKFTAPGGKVALSVRARAETAEKTTLEFTVSDNGIGMTEEFQRELFKPFAQENAGTTSPFAGTGLGLNIARALARRMGGDIVCTSRQGQGTTFVATAVLENTDCKSEAGERAPELVPGGDWDLRGLRVLLCEDHPLNQKITKALLERKGCAVEIASDGQAGVKAVAEHPADYYALILMDIRMPVMDGLEAARQIRALKGAEKLPIIAMSANAFTEDIQKSIAAGMNAHLAKPVDAALLFAAIARFTGRTSREQPRPSVLVVDDIEMNSAIIANVLKHDYDVLTASDGREALDTLYRTKGIVAVVTDIQMPNMDGCELIRAIRDDYQFDGVAILANTQYGAGEQEERLLALGADDFVYKPASPGVLANRLCNVIARHGGARLAGS